MKSGELIIKPNMTAAPKPEGRGKYLKEMRNEE
jgi:hypothetical protein